MSQPAVRTEAHDGARPSAARDLLTKSVGIIISPVVTLRGVARDPRSLAMMMSVSTITALSAAMFLSTGVGKLAWLDEAMRQADAFGQPVTDAQYALLARMREYAAYLVIAQDLVGIPLVIMALAGIIKAVFAVVPGADATYKQTLAIVAASTVILTLRQLVVLPLNYARESMTSATNLAVLLPMLPGGSVLTRFLGAIDLFAVWWLLVLASGLATLYRRRARPIAVTLFALYGVVALALSLVLVWVGGA